VAAAVEPLGAPSVGELLVRSARLLETLPPSSDGTWGAFIAPVEDQLEGIHRQLKPEIDALWDKADAFASQRVRESES
jgi:hypothetical protein